MKLCILISTYDRYRPIAEFTRAMLERYWPEHPPIHICGCAGTPAPAYLTLRDDPRDWIGIMQSAADDLLQAGFDQAYYIMDDCPPMSTCNARHLGVTIPALMDRLQASCISLVGWDQRRPQKGTVLGREFWRAQRQATDFLWRYSTDPCLWNLRALRDILGVLVPTAAPMSRSAWAFERRLGTGQVALPEPWADSSYRICGWDMLDGWAGGWRRRLRQGAYRAYDALRWLTAHLLGSRALAGIDRWAAVETSFYDGPYPTYWAGVMTKGALNADAVGYLRLHGKWRYLSKLRQAVAQIPPPA